MKMNSAVTYLRFLAFSVGIAREFGTNAAILIAYIIDRLPEGDEGAEIEATFEGIESATTLTKKQVMTARESCAAVLKYRHDRLNHRSFWRMDLPALRSLIGGGGASSEMALPKCREGTSGSAVGALRNRTTDLKGERKGGPKVPSGSEKEMIQAFAGVYGSRFRSAYVPHPKHDVDAARALLAAGITPQGVAQAFELATRTKGFWCSKVASLPDLAKRWNDVQAEVLRAIADTPVKRFDHDTADEWKAELNSQPADQGKESK